jgi:hypothetical protein
MMRFFPLTALAILQVMSFESSDSLEENDVLSSFCNAVRQSLLHSKSVAYQATEKLTIEGAVQGKTPYETLRTFTFLRNGNQLDCRLKQQQIFRSELGDKEQDSVEHRFQYLISGGRYFKYSLNTVADQMDPKYTRIYTSQKDPWNLRTTSASTVGKSLDGYIWGDEGKPIWDILNDASSVLQLRPSLEEVDGHDTYVLEGDTKYGHYNLWIDPNCGFNARRIIVRKRGDNLFRGKPVSSPPPKLPRGAMAAHPQVSYNEVLYVLDSISIAKFNDLFVPVSAVATTTYEYVNGEKVQFKQEYKRTGVDLNPDFAKIPDAFDLLVRNGSDVYDLEMPTADFEWSNGKVVAKIDESYLTMIDDTVKEIKKGTDGASPLVKEEDTSKDQPDSPIVVEDARSEDQQTVPAILSETRISTWLLLIPIGLLFVCIVCWQVLIRSKRQGE